MWTVSSSEQELGFDWPSELGVRIPRIDLGRSYRRGYGSRGNSKSPVERVRFPTLMPMKDLRDTSGYELLCIDRSPEYVKLG